MPDTLLPTRLEKLDASNESADKDRFKRLLSIVPYPLSKPLPIAPVTAILVIVPDFVKLSLAVSREMPRAEIPEPITFPSKAVIFLFFPVTAKSPFTMPLIGVARF